MCLTDGKITCCGLPFVALGGRSTAAFGDLIGYDHGALGGAREGVPPGKSMETRVNFAKRASKCVLM